MEKIEIVAFCFNCTIEDCMGKSGQLITQLNKLELERSAISRNVIKPKFDITS